MQKNFNDTKIYQDKNLDMRTAAYVSWRDSRRRSHQALRGIYP